MSTAYITPESSTDSGVPARFDPALARPFILKSVSDETRAAYTRVVRDFFAFVGGVHPTQVKPMDGIAYRDHLLVSKRRKANTVATKLAIVRSFFEYLKAGGVVALNPLSTKLVTPPELPTDPQGRALTPREMRHLLSGPDRSNPAGGRDYAMMLVMARLSLRLSEMGTLRKSSIRWSHGRWILKCKVKGGKEETWPLPKDVKQAIDDYLKLDAPRRRTLHSDGDDAYLFQPFVNYRTLDFNKPLSPRMIQKIVARWGEFTGVGKVTPHNFRHTVVTKLLDDGRTYREIQMVTKHKDPKTIGRYDHGRENIDASPVNTLSYDE